MVRELGVGERLFVALVELAAEAVLRARAVTEAWVRSGLEAPPAVELAPAVSHWPLGTPVSGLLAQVGVAMQLAGAARILARSWLVSALRQAPLLWG